MEDLNPTVTLLNEVFGFDPPTGVGHLEWYYRGNPEGPAAVVGWTPMGDRWATTP